MFGFKYLGNTRVPHRKNTAEMPAVKMPAPDEVLLHVAQHIGAPAKIAVKAGDEVKVGQVIAEAGGLFPLPFTHPFPARSRRWKNTFATAVST